QITMPPLRTRSARTTRPRRTSDRLFAPIPLQLSTEIAAGPLPGVPGRSLHFGDLLIVPHGVQRDVDQPLIRVQRGEHRHGVLRGMLLEGSRGLLRELV